MYEKKNDWVIVLIVLGIVIVAGWLYADHHRNDGISGNTDSTVADIDRRIQSIEGRLDSMQDRLDENQKAVTGIAERIESGRHNAEEIAGGLEQAEGRLDSAIKRSERIEDIIRDIEKANRQGTQSASQTGVAK